MTAVSEGKHWVREQKIITVFTVIEKVLHVWACIMARVCKHGYIHYLLCALQTYCTSTDGLAWHTYIGIS